MTINLCAGHRDKKKEEVEEEALSMLLGAAPGWGRAHLVPVQVCSYIGIAHYGLHLRVILEESRPCTVRQTLEAGRGIFVQGV